MSGVVTIPPNFDGSPMFESHEAMITFYKTGTRVFRKEGATMFEAPLPEHFTKKILNREILISEIPIPIVTRGESTSILCRLMNEEEWELSLKPGDSRKVWDPSRKDGPCIFDFPKK
jgi:hypothetical protein